MTDPPAPSRAHGKAAAIFVFVTVTLDVMAMGVASPVWPQLIRSLVGGDRALGAELLGVFATVFAVMQFLCSPLLGALSDRFGRRPVIILSNFGLAVDYLIMALAPNVGWFFLGRILAGGTSASSSTAYAYIADVTSSEKRAASFGLIGGAFGLGFIMGPMLGGILGQIDPRLPFWAAAGLSLLNGVYGLMVLPESLSKANRGAFSVKRANPVGAFRLLSSHPQLLGFAGVNFILQLAHAVFTTVWILYTADRYHWSPFWIGLSMGVVGVSSVVVQALVVRVVVARLGERRSLLTGLLCGAAGFAICGVATDPWMFMLGIPILCLWGLSGPSIQGLMTRRVSASEQGRLQGANTSVTSVAGLFGPGLFSAVYAFTPRVLPGLPGAAFLLAAGLLTMAMLLAWRVTAQAEPEPHPA